MENNKIGLKIYLLTTLIKKEIEKGREDNKFTGNQGRVLHYLLGQNNDSEIFQKDVEFEFKIKRSTATEILQSLEQLEYIKREPVSYDARLKRIILLPKAKALEPEVEELLEGIDNQLKKNISHEEFEVFEKVISKMITNMK